MKIIPLHSKKNQEQKELQQLLAKLKAEDREAQAYVFAKYSPKMLGVCRQYIRDLQQAEEVMLAAFLKVFTRIETYTNKGNFEGWIRRIMINECLTFLRKKNRLHFVEEDDFFEAIADDPVDNSEQLYIVQQLIDGLKDDYKVIFNLYVVEEYKHREIAEMLGITENASKIRYKRAKELLQEQYNLTQKTTQIIS